MQKGGMKECWIGTLCCCSLANSKGILEVFCKIQNQNTGMFLIKTPFLKRFFGFGLILIRKGGKSSLEKSAGRIFECHFQMFFIQKEP